MLKQTLKVSSPLLLLIVLIAGVNVLGQRPTTQADVGGPVIQTGCGNPEIKSYTALMTLPERAYDVYVRLGKRGESAQVSGYAKSVAETGKCQTLGTRTASGDVWQLLGKFQAGTADTVLQLESSILNDSPDANRPGFMLVDHDDPLCRPQTQCEVTVNGEPGYVTPGGTLLTHNSLHAVRAVDPAEDEVEQVVYYIDNQPAYTTPELEPFDLRYVSFGDRELARVIHYRSGQLIVQPSAVPHDFTPTLGGFAFALFRENSAVIIGLGSVALLAILLLLLKDYLVEWKLRREYRAAHGLALLAKVSLPQRLSPAQQATHARTHRQVERIAQALGLLLLAAITVVLLNTWVVAIYRVTGESMESTLHDGARVAVNKLPMTWAQIENREYVPARGEVIVVDGVFGLTDPVTAAELRQPIVKRVLGLPGERVTVVNGKVTIFNREHPAGLNPDEGSRWQDTMRTGNQVESIDISLGTNEIFVSGDNRPGSLDSRTSGPISVRRIIGPLFPQP